MKVLTGFELIYNADRQIAREVLAKCWKIIPNEDEYCLKDAILELPDKILKDEEFMIAVIEHKDNCVNFASCMPEWALTTKLLIAAIERDQDAIELIKGHHLKKELVDFLYENKIYACEDII